MTQHETEQRVAVLVCVAEPLLQVGVRAALAAEPDMEVINAGYVSVDRRVDVVVADSSTAARFAQDGRRFDLHESLQLARILVISTQAREHAVRCALEQGIHGFVLASSPVYDLLAGVRALARGDTYLCPPVARLLAQISQRDMLTSREDEVLRLLTMGLCNKSIARDLEIAVGTVKTHVKSIMAKLDASCRTEAARIATERGLIDMPDTSSGQVKPLSYATNWLRPASPLPSYA
ncbi:response regulator transcription factor [Paraburkholderia sediminicola]|uniref:response regulator transcription factor n=1 Tax=Paraburkholderia sediminicola TaxID=458836 RepID=UPI0038BAEEDD